jgi:CheY-like chemotaxis protein
MELQAKTLLHILLADDDLDDYQLLNEAFEHSGLQLDFSWAEDGDKLLSLLETGARPDLIFLDINMPYKNGIECLYEIRSKEEFAELPIVMYSTTNYKINIDACYKGGANLYVVKPNSFEEIVSMVKKICTLEWTRTISTPSIEYFTISTF